METSMAMTAFGMARSTYSMIAWRWISLQKLKLLVSVNLAQPQQRSLLIAQISPVTSWFYSVKHAQLKIAQLAASMTYLKSGTLL
jgi:hypothetical protein